MMRPGARDVMIGLEVKTPRSCGPRRRFHQSTAKPPREGSTMTTTPSADPPQVPVRDKPTEEFIRALRRRGRQFRRAEAARKAELQYRVRIERAVLIVARTGADVAPACRSVGLHSMESHRVVRALCDVRGIARRYYWGFPRWKSQVSTTVTVMPNRKEVVRRDDDDAAD
jgi:hypothetical protein